MDTPKRPDKSTRPKKLSNNDGRFDHAAHPSYTTRIDPEKQHKASEAIRHIDRTCKVVRKCSKVSGCGPAIDAVLAECLPAEPPTQTPAEDEGPEEATKSRTAASTPDIDNVALIARRIERQDALKKCRKVWRVLTGIPSLPVKRFEPTTPETAAEKAVEFVATICLGLAYKDGTDEPLELLHSLFCPHLDKRCAKLLSRVRRYVAKSLEERPHSDDPDS
jgi:hypothetical protein